MGGRSRELSCRARSERPLQGALQPGGEEAARSCAPTRAAGEAALAGLRSLLLFQATGADFSGNLPALPGSWAVKRCWRAGMEDRCALLPVPTLFCWPRELPGKAGRSMGFWPLTHRDCY